MHLVDIDLFCAGQPWTEQRRPGAVQVIEKRLGQLATALGDKDWLEGEFTAGDLMMVSVLRILAPGQTAMPDTLAAYIARGEARPAFQAALAAQMADFLPDDAMTKEGVPA